MKLFGFTFFERKQVDTRKPKCLKCANCLERIRKGERFYVISVCHDDCCDPYKNALPHPLIDVLDRGL